MSAQRIDPVEIARPIVYGVSRYRWGWAGWIRWSLSSDGAHWTDSLRPFRWMAVRRARKMARTASGCESLVPANTQQVEEMEHALREYGTFDPQPFGRALRPWG